MRVLLRCPLTNALFSDVILPFSLNIHYWFFPPEGQMNSITSWSFLPGGVDAI